MPFHSHYFYQLQEAEAQEWMGSLIRGAHISVMGHQEKEQKDEVNLYGY